jgi:hypothetical protein
MGSAMGEGRGSEMWVRGWPQGGAAKEAVVAYHEMCSFRVDLRLNSRESRVFDCSVTPVDCEAET